MNVRNIALAALIAVSASGTAFAAADANALRSDINFALTDSGYLDVHIVDGTAYITGYAHLIDLAKAKRVALNAEGIENVVVTATSIN